MSETKPPKIRIEDLTPEALDRLRDLSITMEGGNPRAQQTINELIEIEHPVETSNLPTRADVHFISWLLFVSRTSYPNNPNNPFEKLARSIVETFKAKGGMKAQMIVDLFRNQPNLGDIQRVLGVQEQTQPSLRQRLFGGAPRE